MDSVMQKYVNQEELHGCVTYVQQSGKVLLRRSYGFKDVEQNEEMTNDAIFNIASMAKIVTAVGALKLYEEGKFMLDDPVKDYLPELGNLQVLENMGTDSAVLVPLQRDITIRDLFRHTAGFGYVQNKEEVKDEVDSLYIAYEVDLSNTSEEFLNRISQAPLKYQPGSQWEYSYSNDILGFLVERISQKSLHDYLKETIFIPLGMESTGFYISEENASRLTNIYTHSDNQLQTVEGRSSDHFLTKPTIYSGGGGMPNDAGALVSTVDDFATFCTMLLQHGSYERKKVLQPPTVELLISDQIAGIEDRSFPLAGYGFGVGVNNQPYHGKTKAISWTGAYNTFFLINYESNLVAIFLTQHHPWGYLNIMGEFASVLEKTIPQH
ncbi:serine hydrolase domain-containing protein [Tunicatimonas pelagia]|uniref:serine hydrolase domain-containing protein n=1 Tax=Tunicatimonas pelagia TaxID=931531 RepID=UPI0026669E7B|nr:serine hydrolase domain-containing protein [Tunicatimonas pelagia]WKN40654.1 serine hydrolase [Tunicatimonas pelagia]